MKAVSTVGRRIGMVLLAATALAASACKPSVTGGRATAPSTSAAGTVTGDSTTTIPTTAATTSVAPVASGGPAGLAQLRIGPEGVRTGYLRKLFPTWKDADGDGCNAREDVLIAESLVPARTGAGCAVLSGEWRSAYDGLWITDPAGMQIDHVVPLAEAWESGASAWDAARRRAFANDTAHTQSLIAVSAEANQSKSDGDPFEWRPTDRSDWCRYATDWITVKLVWDLSADPSEARVLGEMLGTCAGHPSSPVPARSASPGDSTATTVPASAPDPAVDEAVSVVAVDCRGEAVTVGHGVGTGAVDLTGWTVHDDGNRHAYTFPNGFGLASGASVVVRSGGPPGPGELGWTSQSVWNNDGDAAYLVAPSGVVVSTAAC